MFLDYGIIPALAGNTRAFLDTEDLFPDHPRSRGEYFRSQKDCSWITGSSPLSRGILVHFWTLRICFRIIPALAGNTLGAKKIVPGLRDHPRSRGEYSCLVRAGLVPRGSSPLSRGILPSISCGACSPGIIPALAGNTSWGIRCPGRGPDHPRSRGEYRAATACGGTTPGSSPLSRGIRCRGCTRVAGTGIIPALAGNTIWARIVTVYPRDHPRSRGEYLGVRG